MDFNKVLLAGRLTKNPEIRVTNNSKGVCLFSMAINRRYMAGEEKKEKVCFVEVKVWGKTAENCSKYLSKGSRVLLEGRLEFDTWETQDGQKRSKLYVVAETVQFVDFGTPKGPSFQNPSSRDQSIKNQSSGERDSGMDFSNQKNSPTSRKKAYKNGPSGYFNEEYEEDTLPF